MSHGLTPSECTKTKHAPWYTRALIPTVLTLSFLLVGCPSDIGDPTPDPDPDPSTEQDIVLTREHLSAFSPGGTLDITIEIDGDRDVDVSAMALIEEVPNDWVYLSAEHALGLLPALRPQEGDGGELTFVWIQPPPLPYTFTYTVGTPASTSGTAHIYGRVEYRIGDGPAESTPTLESETVAD